MMNRILKKKWSRLGLLLEGLVQEGWGRGFGWRRAWEVRAKEVLQHLVKIWGVELRDARLGNNSRGRGGSGSRPLLGNELVWMLLLHKLELTKGWGISPSSLGVSKCRHYSKKACRWLGVRWWTLQQRSSRRGDRRGAVTFWVVVEGALSSYTMLHRKTKGVLSQDRGGYHWKSWRGWNWRRWRRN
jgi:hypothetical protein